MDDNNVRVPSRDEAETHTRQTYAVAGAATLALFGGLVGVLVGWIVGASPRSIPGQGTLAGADIVATTLVAGLFGVGIGALVGALWGLNIPRENAQRFLVEVEDRPLDTERVVPLDYIGSVTISDEAARIRPELGYENANPNPQSLIPNPSEEAAMDDRSDHQVGQDPNNVTGTQGAIDPETGAYGTAGTPITTGYGVSGSTVGTGSDQVRDEHEAGDFAGSTPDSASYEMGGRGSDDSPTPASPDDSSDTPVTEKYKGSMVGEAPVQSDLRTQDVYEAGPAYGPEVGQGKDSAAIDQTSHDSRVPFRDDASLDSPPSRKLINSEEIDASAGTNIAGTADPRGLGDNTDET